MSKPTSNLERLIDAGLIQKDYRLSPDELGVIESLSDDEVECLVSTAKTLGKKYLEKVMNPVLKVY